MSAAHASAQAPAEPSAKVAAGDEAASPCCETARLMQLLRDHPELMPLMKSYLAQLLASEGAQTDEHAITDAMVFSRMQNDQLFARNVSQRLMSLAQATTQALQGPVSEAQQRKPSAPSSTQPMPSANPASAQAA